MSSPNDSRWQRLCEQVGDEARLEKAVEKLVKLNIETPSWGYGAMGTRFYSMHKPGEPRTIWQKLQDAAEVQKFTQAAGKVAIHVPWDSVADWCELQEYAVSLGLTIGAVNPNLFQEDDYLYGSLCHPAASVRSKAVEHIGECVSAMTAVGSRVLSLWLADGTNYPGQDDFRGRKHRLLESLKEVYGMLTADQQLLIEYKPFEPAFYHTDIPDWGTAALLASRLGPRARVLVDLGHHLPGTNIEHIVATLLDEGMLGGFHFNNRKYADDDLTTGSINPYEVFLIFNEIVAADEDGLPVDIAYMIDQSHYIKQNIAAMIQSVINIQRACGRALLVDRVQLAAARAAGDIVAAEECLTDAFNADIDSLLAEVRRRMGVPEDPLKAFRNSGYMAKIEVERAS